MGWAWFLTVVPWTQAFIWAVKPTKMIGFQAVTSNRNNTDLFACTWLRPRNHVNQPTCWARSAAKDR